MKWNISRSFFSKSLMLGAAVSAFLVTPAHAVNFEWSFVNSGGTVGAPPDVVSGRVRGLVDNSVNFQKVTVTLDSITPTIDPAFSVPHRWRAFGNFVVAGGVVTFASFSASDGSLAMNIDTGNAPFVAITSFSKIYEGAGPGSITFTPVSVPDAGSTTALLSLSLAGIGLIRRRLA